MDRNDAMTCVNCVNCNDLWIFLVVFSNFSKTELWRHSAITAIYRGSSQHRRSDRAPTLRRGRTVGKATEVTEVTLDIFSGQNWSLLDIQGS